MGFLKSFQPQAQRQPKSAMEKKLVMKLDIFLLCYCGAAYFFNYLDRAAFANAYVAGLKEDLGLGGNNFSTLLSLYTAGNLLGQFPHALIIQKVQPRIWLPTTLIIWSGLTMCSAACKDYSQLAAVRFFQGFFEASLWSGTIYIIGSWYKPEEVSKRTAIFATVGTLGAMFAGVMMTAMRNTMSGVHGLAGWQWVFILDGALGMPVGIFGLICFPNLPEDTNIFWLKEEERKLALSRMPAKVANTHSISPKTLARRVLAKPAFYILFAFSVHGAMLEAFSFQGGFLLYLKHHAASYPANAPNTYPLGIQAVSIVSMIITGIYIDRTHSRIPICLLFALLQLATGILLAIRSTPPAGVFAAFYISGTSFMIDPIKYGWASVILSRGGDDAVRSVVLYAMNTGGQLLYTWWGIVMYPATDVPYWFKGAIAMVVASVLFPVTLAPVVWLDRRSQKQALTRVEEHAAPETATADADAVEADARPRDEKVLSVAVDEFPTAPSTRK